MCACSSVGWSISLPHSYRHYVFSMSYGEVLDRQGFAGRHTSYERTGEDRKGQIMRPVGHINGHMENDDSWLGVG